MLKIEAKTRKDPNRIIADAVAFFVGRCGLEVKDQSTYHAGFIGPAGGVEISAFTEGRETIVVLVSRECDEQIKEFVQTFAH